MKNLRAFWLGLRGKDASFNHKTLEGIFHFIGRGVAGHRVQS